MNPPRLRHGDWATIGDRTFAVTYERRAWRELDDDGLATGPAHQREDLDRLFSCCYLGVLDGVEVGVEAIVDGVARVSSLDPTPELVERRGMVGNQRDGWVIRAPVDDLRDVRELTVERDTR